MFVLSQDAYELCQLIAELEALLNRIECMGKGPYETSLCGPDGNLDAKGTVWEVGGYHIVIATLSPTRED